MVMNPYFMHRQQLEQKYKEVIDQILYKIKELVNNESEEKFFIEYFIGHANTIEQKKLLETIMKLTKTKHALLRQIYEELAGIPLETEKTVDFIRPENFLEGIKTALLLVLKDIQIHTEIREAMPNQYYRSVMMHILIDAICETSYYNLILTLENIPDSV